MANLGSSLLIIAPPPAFPASLILELLAGADFCGRVVPVPFDESAAVRLGAAGLLIDIEYSRVRDSSWMYLTSFVTTRIGIELTAVQGNYRTGL